MTIIAAIGVLFLLGKVLVKVLDDASGRVIDRFIADAQSTEEIR